MKKVNPKEIAEKVFKANPDATEVFVTSDGYSFLKRNAAELHATTNPKKKKFKVYEFKNTPAVEKKENQEKALNKMNKTELQAEATKLGIEFKPEETKADLVAKIESVKNTEIKE